MIGFLRTIYRSAYKWFNIIFYGYVYRWTYVPYKVNAIRRKARVRVLFVLYDLSLWKSERLYQAMLECDRFEPILGVCSHRELPGGEKLMQEYCRAKGYKVKVLDDNANLIEQCHPDIIFYQKPYRGDFQDQHWINKNRKALCAYVNYAMCSSVLPELNNELIHLTCWQNYLENESSFREISNIQINNGINNVLTGTPVMDELMDERDKYDDSWNTSEKKRIIYAPHHSLPGMGAENMIFSTFLETGPIMQNIAKKYKDKVHFVFKPHPRLYRNLVELWGKDKADEYYDFWRNLENAQFESGEYMSLFKYSDAMIHDCSSFTIEYMYTHNPVMYLTNNQQHDVYLCTWAKKAYQMHYKGYTEEDIEHFIENVINDIDPMKEEREKYFHEYLIPPYGKTACENIMNAILGVEEYKKY